jgi:hypothetical protein
MMLIGALDPMFVLSNRLEAGLWSIIGIAFLISAIRTRRVDAWIAAAGFFAFGGSDVVESHTGAWWRPWWLLGWKGLCLLVFLVLIIRHISRRNGQRMADKGRLFNSRQTAPPPTATVSHPPAEAQNPDPSGTR